MKRIILGLLVSGFMVFATLGRGVADDFVQPQKNLVMFNPAALIFGFVAAEYERALTEKISVSILGQFVRLSSGDVSVTGIGGGISPRFFVFKQALNGLFLSPGIELVSISAEDDVSGETESAFGFSIPFILGYTWIWGKEVGFALSLGIGAQYFSLEALDVSFTGVLPVVRLALGIGF